MVISVRVEGHKCLQLQGDDNIQKLGQYLLNRHFMVRN